jgi:protein involved in polysaccharide export with SLBB domain
MMKKPLLFLLLLGMFPAASIYGQTMTDDQIIEYAKSKKVAGASESDIASGLLKQGATMSQIQRLRGEYAEQINKAGYDAVVDAAIDDASRMRTENAPVTNAVSSGGSLDGGSGGGGLVPADIAPAAGPGGRQVFGRDIFNNGLLTFEPQMNIATPTDYVLGPGDQLVVDVYGDTQRSQMLIVSPDGDITVPDYGPIAVSGLTVEAAQRRIRQKLGSSYSGSSIKLSVAQTRSILVNIMGEVRTPGTYTISAFATVFHALYRAGGISELGTLRSIKVVRGGKVVTVVDVYEFIIHGRLAGNIRLVDDDVIQVGPYESIVEIGGEVKRPMAYEMRKDETLATLLEYCGGFTADAYKQTISLQRNSEKMRSVYNVDEFEWSSFKIKDGDAVSVGKIYDRYENMVEVNGAVYRPGRFQLGAKVNSVRTLIESADGLKEEAMTTRAVIRRLKPNRTHEVIAIDLQGILAGTSPDVPLQNEDALFIPTIPEHQNHRTLTISGEVIAPGTFDFDDDMTLEDLVLKAGGLTDAASVMKVDVSRRLRDPHATEGTMEIAKTYTFTLQDDYVIDGQSHFKLEPYDIVQVRRSPVFQDPITVTINGEVQFRGNYTMETKNQRLSDLVKAAGGIAPGADVRGARLVRVMSADERARMEESLKTAAQNNYANSRDSVALETLAMSDTYTVGICLDEALANPGGKQDIELQNGDVLTVPRYNHTVRISGDVHKPNTVAYIDGKNWKYYVDQAGGFGARARKSHAYVLYMNGTIARAKKGDVEPGCEIVVPTKGPRNNATTSQWVAIGTGIASIATMITSITYLIKR